ncbi:protein fam185a-like [Plakobranchus ocellatus]|uniref:Protein fam185a-like n=1 Tax=Plakobranchus ocellatus TaxID=259542 RepID=A0AAV4AWL3_9GAST|nr:protein fam185a-like [Plakobranchus ocellatus]
MDKVIIEVHFDKTCGAEAPPSHELSHIGDLYKLNVLFDKDAAKMTVTAQATAGVTLPLVCRLWIPLQSDLSAAVISDKDLTVENLEGNIINLVSQNGNCYLKSLKSRSVNVQCSTGNIVSRSTVLGNVVFHAGKSGSITADKLQGSSVICETELGAVAVKSLYADTAVMRTTGGSIHLGQCHGQILLQGGQANVKIDSLEGDIDAGLLTGNVDVHLSRHSNSNIDIKNGKKS